MGKEKNVCICSGAGTGRGGSLFLENPPSPSLSLPPSLLLFPYLQHPYNVDSLLIQPSITNRIQDLRGDGFADEDPLGGHLERERVGKRRGEEGGDMLGGEPKVKQAAGQGLDLPIPASPAPCSPLFLPPPLPLPFML